MTCLDTIEFTTHTDYIRNLKMDNFIMTNRRFPNGYKEKKYSLKNKITGLSRITINDTRESVRINASSKILGINYPKGIDFNTLDQFRRELTKTGLELDKDFINDCQLNRVDIKNDVKTDKEPHLYVNSLNQLNASKFFKTNYETSISFKERIKTTPLTFTAYSKAREIESNKGFYNDFPSIGLHFDNIFRIETKLLKSATIKKYFKSRDLIKILSSTDFNLKIFDKIIDQQTNFKPLVDTSNMTNTQEKNFAHIFYLNQFYRGDTNRIIKHIESKLAKNTKASYQRKKVKEYLSMINNTSECFFEDIEEIKSKLREHVSL